MSAAPGLFLSYARGDDESFVKRLFEDLRAAGFHVWWDRESMPSRGLKFTQEIRDAIDGSERLVLVVGPSAIGSDYVRAEWEHALLFAKGVIPILRLGEFSSLPSDLRQFHCLDFRKGQPYEERLGELRRVLAQPVAPLGPLLTSVPVLPPHFMLLREQMAALRERVLADVEGPVVVGFGRQSTALQGMGAVGKSVLAAAFARATDTRRAFRDGILWLPLGPHGEVSRSLGLALTAFGERAAGYLEVDDARRRLQHLLELRSCLIVLDDVWSAEHAKVFRDALGIRCRLLMTTRDSSLATALGVQSYSLGPWNDVKALELLGEWSGQPTHQLPADASAVATECGGLPLALALCGARARDGLSWTDVLSALRAFRLEYIDDRQGTLARSLRSTFEALPQPLATRYAELAVFPAAEPVPASVVAMLWKHTGGLDPLDARTLMVNLGNKALLRLEGEPDSRIVTLHVLQHDYLQATVKDMASLHRHTLGAYEAACPGSWAAKPNDGYFFQHLAWHLAGSGRESDLRKLLVDFDWIQAKAQAVGLNEVIRDYGFVQDDPEMQLVGTTLRMSAHAAGPDKSQLAGQLCGRLLSNSTPQIEALVAKASKWKPPVPWVRPTTAILARPGGTWVRTFSGHTTTISSMAISSDGRRTCSLSSDGVLKLWDTETGGTVQSLKSEGGFRCVALSADGRRAIAGCYDGALQVFEVESGREIRTLQAAQGFWAALRDRRIVVESVTLSGDGRLAVSVISEDREPKVWDVERGEVVHVLRGHKAPLTGVAISPEGRRAMSASDDLVMKIWDTDSGRELSSLGGHTSRVNSVALSADGRVAISASADMTLKVWDGLSGQEVGTLRGHRAAVVKVVVSSDARRALSVDLGTTFIEWDLTACRELRRMETGAGVLSKAALSEDLRHAVTCSFAFLESALRVWDLTKFEPSKAAPGPTVPAPRPAGPSAFPREDATCDAISGNGRLAICRHAGRPGVLWNTETGRQVKILPAGLATARDVVLSWDGQQAIATSARWFEDIDLWDLESEKILGTIRCPKRPYGRTVFSGNGLRAVCSSEKQAPAVWDLENGRQLNRLRGCETAAGLLLDHDGRWAVGASTDAKTLTVWNLETGRIHRTIRDSWTSFYRMAFSGDGRRAISVGFLQDLVKVWNVERGEQLHTLRGHTGEVKGVAISADGRRAVSASSDHTLKVWDVDSALCVATFTADGRLGRCTLSANGVAVAVCLADAAGRDVSVHFLRFEEARPSY